MQLDTMTLLEMKMVHMADGALEDEEAIQLIQRMVDTGALWMKPKDESLLKDWLYFQSIANVLIERGDIHASA